MGDDVVVTPDPDRPTVHAYVVDTPLSVDRALVEVAHERAGAVALFVGVVRDHDGGRDGVVRLDYSAHPSAPSVMEQLAGRVAARAGVRAVVAAHRTGMLRVGDLAVICAVSADHRPEAFAGCRELIEELKGQVPIWKQQEFADGLQEWVGV
jgi:molybdopterin synthase catalytic subunit